jgi:cytochrome b involved in lipid metabolism
MKQTWIAALGAFVLVGAVLIFLRSDVSKDAPKDVVSGTPTQRYEMASSTDAIVTTSDATTSPEVVSGTVNVSSTVQVSVEQTQTHPTGITAEEVAKHALPEDCWSIVNGSVYNLTAWIAKHPGGSGAIARMCGIDGSAGFNRKHGGQEKPEAVLEGFFVGKLTE